MNKDMLAPVVGGRVVAVVGPTASGKTKLAVALAESLGGELVNADSRQAITELAVAVCKPTAEELHGTPCHGLDWRELGRPFSVQDFVIRGERCLADVWRRGQVPVVVGGSGLYVRALLAGFDFASAPPPNPFGEGLGVATGREDAVAALSRLAPALAATVDLRNPRRVRRALDWASVGRTPGVQERGWRSVQIGCRVSPAVLRARIQERAERLMGPELLAELDGLLEAGHSSQVVAQAAIGYAEALKWQAGECSREAAVEALARRTWRYCRSQLTWWRREPEVVWVDAEADGQGMVASCQSLLTSRWHQELS